MFQILERKKVANSEPPTPYTPSAEPTMPCPRKKAKQAKNCLQTTNFAPTSSSAYSHEESHCEISSAEESNGACKTVSALKGIVSKKRTHTGNSHTTQWHRAEAITRAAKGCCKLTVFCVSELNLPRHKTALISFDIRITLEVNEAQCATEMELESDLLDFCVNEVEQTCRDENLGKMDLTDSEFEVGSSF